MKFNFDYRKLGLSLLISLTIGLICNDYTMAATNPTGYDSTRIFHAMAKARRGEPVTIGVIGGSITAGSAASTEANRWANLMTDWWMATFPASTITLKNAGIGGTGSDIGTHRLYRDLLDFDPDFIVVEFSVNDTEGQYAEKMMEGVVRQTLQADSLPGIMLLLLKMQNGTTAATSHKNIGNYYDVPLVSFADSIDGAVAEDGNDLNDIYVDGLHPNDLGMQYIADFLIEELNLIYAALPDDADLPAITTTLPDYLVSDVYAHASIYGTTTIAPVSNTGWWVSQDKWKANTVDSQIDFSIVGNAISFIYTRHNTTDRGQIEAWVDDGPHQIFDAYWEETWGPGQRFALIQENLADGEHILHLKVINSTSTGEDGHYFEVVNICQAGNWITAPPIAKAGSNVKVYVGTMVTLDGTASFDPDSDTIVSYEWSVVDAPASSTANILAPMDSITEFEPDVEGKYRIGLVVNDGIINSVTGIKIITAKLTNNIPIANAGENKNVATKVWCYPDGSASSDEDGDVFSYSWRKIAEPAGSSVTLYDPTISTPKFKPGAEGEYILGLVVNDSLDLSIEDSVVYTAIDGYSGFQEMSANGLTLASYPNPVKDIFHIQYSVPFTQNITIELISVTDKKKFELLHVPAETGDHTITLNLSEYQLATGVYFLQLLTADSTVYNKIAIY